jgi:hypothetical protein
VRNCGRMSLAVAPTFMHTRWMALHTVIYDLAGGGALLVPILIMILGTPRYSCTRHLADGDLIRADAACRRPMAHCAFMIKRGVSRLQRSAPTMQWRSATSRSWVVRWPTSLSTGSGGIHLAPAASSTGMRQCCAVTYAKARHQDAGLKTCKALQHHAHRCHPWPLSETLPNQVKSPG